MQMCALLKFEIRLDVLKEHYTSVLEYTAKNHQPVQLKIRCAERTLYIIVQSC